MKFLKIFAWNIVERESNTIAKRILKFGGRRWRKKDLENYLTKGNRIFEGIEGGMVRAAYISKIE